MKRNLSPLNKLPQALTFCQQRALERHCRIWATSCSASPGPPTPTQQPATLGGQKLLLAPPSGGLVAECLQWDFSVNNLPQHAVGPTSSQRQRSGVQQPPRCGPQQHVCLSVAMAEPFPTRSASQFMGWEVPVRSYQPTRLLRPWDSPGENTGVRCHFLLQGIFQTQGWNPHLMSPALAGRFFTTITTWEALLDPVLNTIMSAIIYCIYYSYILQSSLNFFLANP